MRKVISLSGLLAGLIAAPGLAGPGAGKALGEEFAERSATQSAIVLPARCLTEEDRRRLQSALLQMVEKGPEDIGGMKALQQRMAAQMQSQMQGLLLAQGSNPPAIVEVPEVRIVPAGLVVMGPTEKATFLGVTTSHPEPALADQLQLPKGMGLVVDFIAKDSPAELAGLQRHDVLTKLDDQLLINMEQLAVLVRSKKPGATITLTAIRAGKPLDLKAKLVEHDSPIGFAPEGFRGNFELRPADPANPGPGFRLVFGNPGQNHAAPKFTDNRDGSITQTVESDGNHVAVTLDKTGKTSVLIKDKDEKEIYNGPLPPADGAKLEPKIGAILKNAGLEEMHVPDGSATTIVRRSDGTQNITVTIIDNHAKLTVTDAKTGQETYTGNADTDDDFKKMPDGVAEKVHTMLSKIPPAK